MSQWNSQWNPRENADHLDEAFANYRDLNEAWNVFQTRYEGFGNVYEASDEGIASTSQETTYNVSPFDDSFFHPPTKIKFKIPEFLQDCVRSFNNRRAGKLVFVFTSTKHFAAMDRIKRNIFRFVFIAMWKTSYQLLLFVQFEREWRMKDIKREFAGCGVTSAEFFYAVKVKETYSKIVSEYGQPEMSDGTLPGTATEKSNQKFNHAQLAEFAESRRITDVQILMWEYAHLAHRDCDRTDENSKQHDEDHIEQMENARKFLHLPDRKRTARNAGDVTRAAIYAELNRIPNIKYIENESLILGERLVEQANFQALVGQASFYLFNVVGFHKFKCTAVILLSLFIHAHPKRRYVCLKGPYNSGKTTFAYAWCSFLNGTVLSVNIDPSRMNFTLGNAIGHRYVLFDDVKGEETEDNYEFLGKGAGWSNLDNYRDHIDGHMEINLEKKHEQFTKQKFPPGIITTNNYLIPSALMERIQVIHFKGNKPMFDLHPFTLTKEHIYTILVMLNLIPAEPHIIQIMSESFIKWQKETRKRLQVSSEVYPSLAS
ncbi:uncharacterized protein LOC118184493 [Stegodyphus dumicola]|uniref:uncharacterized protein LOC118184493 n=1 Tax=Stegodyphus dumicola TaxID=202533 RepID=UPI0015AABD3D|nr:uncharacterized protein LOC118184493 [Stegodyphus dumicola]